LRPMMPSMLPRVGAGRHPGVFYNTGHGHLGWTLSAATAEMVGETVRAGMRKSKLSSTLSVHVPPTLELAQKPPQTTPQPAAQRTAQTA